MQPSVSYAIKQLEQAFGVKLFDRLSKGVRLTAEGTAVLEYVERSFAIIEQGERRLQAIRNLQAGELRIGSSGPIIKHLLLPLLDQYHAAYPHVRIRLLQSKSDEIGTRLKEGAVDLGFIHMPLQDSELDVTPLTEIQDIFVVGEAYRELAARPVTAHELAQTPLLMLTPGSSTRAYVERWFASEGVACKADIELSSTDMLVELAERGYGAAFVTRSFVAAELAEGRLLEVRLQAAIPPRRIGIVTRRQAALPTAVEAFLRTARIRVGGQRL
jgi:DNA-binding transcriptional LysR family regulator